LTESVRKADRLLEIQFRTEAPRALATVENLAESLAGVRHGLGRAVAHRLCQVELPELAELLIQGALDISKPGQLAIDHCE
jgi:hypothetical protein